MLESSAFQGQDAPLERVQPIRLSLGTDEGLRPLPRHVG